MDDLQFNFVTKFFEKFYYVSMKPSFKMQNLLKESNAFSFKICILLKMKITLSEWYFSGSLMFSNNEHFIDRTWISIHIFEFSYMSSNDKNGVLFQHQS